MVAPDFGKAPLDKQTRLGIQVSLLIAIGMLLYALLGDPPYSFFAGLKMVTGAASLVSAWAIYKSFKWGVPLCILLFAIAGMQALAHLKREEWALYDWEAVVLFSVSFMALQWVPERPTRLSAYSFAMIAPLAVLASLGGTAFAQAQRQHAMEQRQHEVEVQKNRDRLQFENACKLVAKLPDTAPANLILQNNSQEDLEVSHISTTYYLGDAPDPAMYLHSATAEKYEQLLPGEIKKVQTPSGDQTVNADVVAAIAAHVSSWKGQMPVHEVHEVRFKSTNYEVPEQTVRFVQDWMWTAPVNEFSTP